MIILRLFLFFPDLSLIILIKSILIKNKACIGIDIGMVVSVEHYISLIRLVNPKEAGGEAK